MNTTSDCYEIGPLRSYVVDGANVSATRVGVRKEGTLPFKRNDSVKGKKEKSRN